jgi:hypothetical protein
MMVGGPMEKQGTRPVIDTRAANAKRSMSATWRSKAWMRSRVA